MKMLKTAVKCPVTKSILSYLYEKYKTERNPILSRGFQYSNANIREKGTLLAAIYDPIDLGIWEERRERGRSEDE